MPPALSSKSCRHLAIGLLAGLAILLTPPLRAQQKNTPSWPGLVKAGQGAAITEIPGNPPPYIYRTKHFELHANQKLNLRDSKLFAATVESVPVILKRLPLPLLRMPDTQRAQIHIYPDEDSYLRHGGAPNTAGVYRSKTASILLRADAFFTPPQRPGSRLPPKADYDLLVHEFTHLCMHGNLGYVPVWFSEGTAEYLSAAHQHQGSYDFKRIHSHIVERIKRHLPNDPDTIQLPRLDRVMAMDYPAWTDYIKEQAHEDHYRIYATSLLLVHTLFHGGEARREATRRFIADCHDRSRRADAAERLLPAAERKQLQQRIIQYWKPKGLKISFAP